MKTCHLVAALMAMVAAGALCVGAFLYGFRLGYDEMAAGEAGLPFAKQVAVVVIRAIFFIPTFFRMLLGQNAPVAISFALQFAFYTAIFYVPLLRFFRKQLP
jgi:hypothetical protein